MTEGYEHYKLPDLWKIVQGEDPEYGFTHVNTLNRLRTALEQQRDNLRTHRDRLAEGWPPAQSEAATAFVGRINQMIDALEATASAAGTMSVGVDEAFAAMREARRQLESLMAKYARAPGQGLVADNAKSSEMDQQGRDALIVADARIVGAAEKINSVPPPYRRFDEPGTTLPPAQGSDSGGSGQSTGSHGAGSGGSGMLQVPVFDPPPPSVTTDDGLTLTQDRAVGPVGVIGGPSGTVSPSPSVPGGAAFRPGVVGPGGVIGSPRPPATTPTTSRGTRPGPVQDPAVSPRPIESRGTVGAPGGYRDRSYEAYAQRRRSKQATSGGDELWAVDEGVPPVIEAPPERQHDPGPGVLGIDR